MSDNSRDRSRAAEPQDPRADPLVVDLIELAGLWLAAEDWAALRRTLLKLDEQLRVRFEHDTEFAARFRELQALLDDSVSADELRRRYRRATLG